VIKNETEKMVQEEGRIGMVSEKGDVALIARASASDRQDIEAAVMRSRRMRHRGGRRVGRVIEKEEVSSIPIVRATASASDRQDIEAVAAVSVRSTMMLRGRGRAHGMVRSGRLDDTVH